jgi:hypothetical protein
MVFVEGHRLVERALPSLLFVSDVIQRALFRDWISVMRHEEEAVLLAFVFLAYSTVIISPVFSRKLLTFAYVLHLQCATRV